MTCTDPTLGSATLTGTAAGVNATSFVDGYHIKSPARYNWEWTSILTTRTGGCARHRLYQRATGEVWVWAKLYAGRVNTGSGDYALCPPPPMPSDGSGLTLSLTAAAAAEEILDPGTGAVLLTRAAGAGDYRDANGNLYVPMSKLVSFSGSRCTETARDPSGGSVTYATLADPYTWSEASYTPTGETGTGLMAGTLNSVSFPDGSQVSGGFSAPFCSLTGCPPRPSKPSCVS